MPKGHAGLLVEPEPLIVGAAVLKRRRHARDGIAQPRLGDGARFDQAGETAHQAALHRTGRLARTAS